ncbi:MAG: hypothetical protein ISP56_06685 [Flavobacteriaceae bacterium]|nr:hypothetical protein [Flavobacteriaceae bacterium]
MAFTSIVSVLDCINEKVKIYIIHNSQEINFLIPEYINNHRNLEEINIKIFSNPNNVFPNVENSHVSEATYFRLFLENYIENDVDYLIYLDADVICLKNPLAYFKSTIKAMKSKNLPIAAMNHEEVPVKDKRLLDLGITKGKYFNAGVMIIDYELWRKSNVLNKSVKIIQNKSQSLVLWDQDVLNVIFDGNFENINPYFNYRMNMLNFSQKEVELIEQNVFLLHYYGKSKPWSVKGVSFGIAEYYQSEFRKFQYEKYHIVHNWKKGSLLYIFQIVLSGKIFSLKYPVRFLQESFKTFIK